MRKNFSLSNIETIYSVFNNIFLFLTHVSAIIENFQGNTSISKCTIRFKNRPSFHIVSNFACSYIICFFIKYSNKWNSNLFLVLYQKITCSAKTSNYNLFGSNLFITLTIRTLNNTALRTQ